MLQDEDTVGCRTCEICTAHTKRKVRERGREVNWYGTRLHKFHSRYKYGEDFVLGVGWFPPRMETTEDLYRSRPPRARLQHNRHLHLRIHRLLAHRNPFSKLVSFPKDGSCSHNHGDVYVLWQNRRLCRLELSVERCGEVEGWRDEDRWWVRFVLWLWLEGWFG